MIERICSNQLSIRNLGWDHIPAVGMTLVHTTEMSRGEHCLIRIMQSVV